MSNGTNNENRITEILLAFVDFLYAVVFALIVAEAYDKVIVNLARTPLETLGKIFLITGVFYLLSWDWLHARLLTTKNPYVSYRRFFMEILIAFAGYGAALRAIEGKISFLLYVLAILWIGVVWAHRTRKEYPNSVDLKELKNIVLLQSVAGILVLVAYVIWFHNQKGPIAPLQTIWIVALG